MFKSYLFCALICFSGIQLFACDSLQIKTENMLSTLTLKQKVHEIHGRGILRNFFGFVFNKKNKPVRFGGNKKLGIPIGAFEDVSILNKKTVVCISAGSTIVTSDWENNAAAILHVFYPGVEGGSALARLLSGELSPSGKLPFSIPNNENDLPIFNSFDSVVYYDYFHGYRFLEYFKKEISYPFGFGLTYTSFQISGVKTFFENDSLLVSLNVKNIGERDGSEVIQLYAGNPPSEIIQAHKRLVRFKKVFLKTNETTIVDFILPLSELKNYNEVRNEWYLPNGIYEFYLGNSCSDAEKYKIFSITR